MVCGAIWLTGRLATEATSTMRNGAASAAPTIAAAASEPNRRLRRRIETAVSVHPVAPEDVRTEPALRLLGLAVHRLARPAAEQAAIMLRLLLRVGRRRRRPV